MNTPLADRPPVLASSHETAAGAPLRELNLFDCTCIIVGIIIGAGFYETTPQVARAAGSLPWLVAVWLFGGVVSLIGAICYAELTTTWPKEGGEYVYLTRAFGRRMGFLFAWAGFWVVRPGNIGAMAYVFARYAQELRPLPLGGYGFMAYASVAVVLLTVVNVLGVRTGKWTQNLLTAAKVLGMLAVFGVGLLLVRRWTPGPVPRFYGLVNSTPTWSDLSLAMILVLFTYGGWNEMSYVAAEVRNPRKNLTRALLLGTTAVTVIYVLGNLAFVRALGLTHMGNTQAVAADVLRLRFDRWGAAAISVLICVSRLGATNGMIFTGARIYYALGADRASGKAYAWLGRWDPRLGTPVRSLVLQALVTLALVVGFGAYENGFERMVVFTAPLFWLFFLLTGVALIVLRFTERDTPRPYRVPLYPITPVLFCLSSAYLLYASLDYAWANRRPEALWTLAIMGVGIVLAWMGREPDGRRGFAVMPGDSSSG